MANVLLIDDSESLLELFRHAVEKAGHRVLATSCGTHALAMLREHRIDVVVTDLYMPPPDGFEIIQAVRKGHPRLPIIVMSTNGLACDVLQAGRAMGAVEALQKPFTDEALLAAIAKTQARAA